MRIKFKGDDLGEWKGMPTLKEARLIKRELGMLPQQFGEAIGEMDPEALSMLVAIMRTRGGRPTKFDDVDGEFEDFDAVLSDEEQAMMQADAADEDEAGKDSALNVKPELSLPGSVTSSPISTGPLPATRLDSGSSSG